MERPIRYEIRIKHLDELAVSDSLSHFIIHQKVMAVKKEGHNVASEIFKMLGKFIINYRDNKIVGLLGIEPRLFWTKTRRVASYTIGQYN